MNEIERLQYQDELKANKFSCMFLTIMNVICLLVWGANEIGLFVVNKIFMRVGIIFGCICLVIPLILYLMKKGQRKWFKYVVIICVSFMAIAIQTFLTFHGVMLCVFPILLAAQYSRERVFKLAFVINLIGILASVVMGYYVGCWDGNMIYATTYGISLAKDSVEVRASIMNGNYMMQLLAYFALPRMVIFSAISISVSYILKTAKLQYVRQNIIKMQAESDALTGLENRTKYNQRVQNEYPKLDSVYIAFIDVNFLKKMNDICGHEAGDSVLRRVANEMKRIIDERIHGYRLGGDEFAFVFCDYEEETARKIIEKWEEEVAPLNRREDSVQCSLAVGGAYSKKTFDIEDVMREADKNMYERKKKMKAERLD